MKLLAWPLPIYLGERISSTFIKKPFRIKLPKAIEIYFEPLYKFSFIQILRICCCALGLLNLTFAFRGINSFRFSSILEMLEVSKPIKDMHAVLFRDFQEQPFKILEFSMLQIPLAYRWSYTASISNILFKLFLINSCMYSLRCIYLWF